MFFHSLLILLIILIVDNVNCAGIRWSVDTDDLDDDIVATKKTNFKNKKLHKAIINGDEAVVRNLYKKFPKTIHVPGNNGLTPFLLAAKNNQLKIMKFLLNFEDIEIDINEKAVWPDEIRNSALHYAIENKNLEMVKFLIENNAQVNSTASIGNTPLHMATALLQLEIVELLLKNNAKVDQQDLEGFTPIHLILYVAKSDEKKAKQILKELLKHCDKNCLELKSKIKKQTALELAIEFYGSKSDFVKLIQGEEINDDNENSNKNEL